MKYKSYIKLGFAIIIMVGIYAFASVRNRGRVVEIAEITFNGENNLFITKDSVSKLLIQKLKSNKNTTKDILDLNVLEQGLNSNEMIKSAQVYSSVNGKLVAEVNQRQPLARVLIGEQQYYIDDQGLPMPLSSHFSARVPMLTGVINKDSLATVYRVLSYIKNDVFLTKHVIEIHQDENYQFRLKFRNYPFTVYLGTINAIDKKINNLKAFYQKAQKDNMLYNYSQINLNFDNQVVCTKI